MIDSCRDLSGYTFQTSEAAEARSKATDATQPASTGAASDNLSSSTADAVSVTDDSSSKSNAAEVAQTGGDEKWVAVESTATDATPSL